MNTIFPDRAVSPRDYAIFGKDHVLVTKVFATVQGEGPFAGVRAVFIRLAGCNLGGKGVQSPGCAFCDTDFRFDQGKPTLIDDVVKQACALHPSTGPVTSRLFVITGGEPFIQPNVVELVSALTRYGGVQIESNGTYDVPDLPKQAFVVVSPKVLQGCNIKEPRYYQPQAHVLERADCLKFVVSADQQSPYHTVPNYALRYMQLFPDREVYVSPMAIYRPEVTSPNKTTVSIWDRDVFDQKACAANHAYAARLAMLFGFRMSVQMHLYSAVE